MKRGLVWICAATGASHLWVRLVVAPVIWRLRAARGIDRQYEPLPWPLEWAIIAVAGPGVWLELLWKRLRRSA